MNQDDWIKLWKYIDGLPNDEGKLLGIIDHLAYEQRKLEKKKAVLEHAYAKRQQKEQMKNSESLFANKNHRL